MSSEKSATSTNVRAMQDILLIWLDSTIDENNDDYKNNITQLRHSIQDINTFTDSEQCVQFLESIDQVKACMIISGSLGQHIVSRVHDMSQVECIFIFCDNKKYHEQWAKDWLKIKGVFTKIKPICEALEQVIQQCVNNPVQISFMSADNHIVKHNLDRLDPSFMYMQILKEILLSIEFEPKQFRQFIDYCLQQFSDNDYELDNVQKLEREYRDRTPIWWYTYESFLYRMLNRALRTMDTDIIVRMGFYIRDLHQQITQMHSEQFYGHHNSDVFTVYRGQQLPKADFDKLTKTKGGLMASNNFLTTSKDRNISLNFVCDNLTDPNMLGVLFVMTIDPAQPTTPFASIATENYHKSDDEVLLSMQSVFRIRDIKRMTENDRLYQIDLILTSDYDHDLRELTDHIRKKTEGETGWYRLGGLLLEMGKFDQAEEIYNMLLADTTDESGKACAYHRLGMVKNGQGDYQKAIEFHEKALEIRRKSLPPNHLDLGMTYNNIGLVYCNMDYYEKALSYHEKALEIRQKSLSPNHPDLGMSYNNIGLVYCNMGDYAKALSCHEKAFAIQQQSLPPNHPDLGMTYNNMGLVYCNMGDYEKALSYDEKSLAIQQQSLPSSHPDLGMTYNNIGFVYCNMGDYEKALSYHKKALEIRQKSLPPNHPDLGTSYNNIGLAYEKIGEISKARSSYERAVAIGNCSLSSKHPNLGKWRKNLENIEKK